MHMPMIFPAQTTTNCFRIKCSIAKTTISPKQGKSIFQQSPLAFDVIACGENISSHKRITNKKHIYSLAL
jgi:hypothetical protein